MKKTFIVLIAIVTFALGGLAHQVSTKQTKYTNLSFSTRMIYGDTAYFTINGEIGYGSSESFANDLAVYKQKGIKKLIIRLNSGGGIIFDGLAYADLIMQARKTMFVEIRATGLVASAAVPILVAANWRTATKHTMFMVHRPQAYTEEQRKLIDFFNEKYIDVVVSGSNLSKEEVNKMMTVKGTWFGAKKALEWGLIDKIS